MPVLPCSSQQAFLLENVPCNNASCEGAHRMFRVYWELTDLSQIREAQVATFFDIYEDVSPRWRGLIAPRSLTHPV